MTIYHVAYEADWIAAREAGQYVISTKGRTLAEQGFIHAATVGQVAPVANMYYGDDEGLVVLVIDERLLKPELRYDEVPGSEEPFPHIYGPLNVDAVTEEIPLVKGSDGTYHFPG